MDSRAGTSTHSCTGTVNLAYDLGNRITALSGAVVKTYAYDKLDRLTTYNTTQTYQYDANGNRTQFKNGTAIGTLTHAAWPSITLFGPPVGLPPKSYDCPSWACAFVPVAPAVGV